MTLNHKEMRKNMSKSSKTFLFFIVLQVKNLSSLVCCPELLYYLCPHCCHLKFWFHRTHNASLSQTTSAFPTNTIQLQTCFKKKKICKNKQSCSLPCLRTVLLQKSKKESHSFQEPYKHINCDFYLALCCMVWHFIYQHTGHCCFSKSTSENGGTEQGWSDCEGRVKQETYATV